MTTPVSTTIEILLKVHIEGVVLDGRPAMDLAPEVDDIAITGLTLNNIALTIDPSIEHEVYSAIGEEALVDALWSDFHARAP